MGDNILYLGKNFSFDMNNVDVKAELVAEINILNLESVTVTSEAQVTDYFKAYL